MTGQKTTEEYRRGRRIIPADRAAEIADKQRPKDDIGLTWGGIVLPSSEAVTHFCAVGATGSGKTTLMRLLLQSVVPLIGSKYKTKSSETGRFVEVDPTEADWKHYHKQKEQFEQKYQAQVQAEKEKERQRVIRANQEIESANAKIDANIKELQHKVQAATRSCWKYLAFVGGLGLPSTMRLWGWADSERDFSYHESIAIVLIIISCFFFKQLLAKGKNIEEVKKRIEELKGTYIDKLTQGQVNVSQIPKQNSPLPSSKKVWKTEQTSPQAYHGEGHRALVYDAKNDSVSMLYGMRPMARIVILNPFDARSAAWDIAADISTPAAARQFATILIPEDKNASQPFFANSARDILANAVVALIKKKPGEWTLRDVYLATTSRDRLLTLLNSLPETFEKAQLYFGEDRTGANIMSEIATRLAPFEYVAAAWSHAREKVSLKHWLENEYILVLGTNEEHRAALDPINRTLFQRMTELILSQSESYTRRTWIFLDEVRDAGNLESLGRLMTKGRSKGACVVLGFQDIEGMHDAFGKEKANELIGQCSNKAILRLNSPETAEWASKLFGEYEFMEDETGENRGGSTTAGYSKTEGETLGETVTHGTTSGSSFGTSQGTSEGTSTGKSYGSSSSSASVGNTFSNQTSSQKSTQTSKQTSEQTSNQTSESRANQTSKQTSRADSNSNSDTWSTTINKKRMEKKAILPSEIASLPITNPRNGLHGYYVVPSVGAFYGVLSGEFIKNSLAPFAPNQPNYLPRPVEQQYLQPWTEEEMVTLGVAFSSHKKTTAKVEDVQKSTVDANNKLRNSRSWLPETDEDNGLIRL